MPSAGGTGRTTRDVFHRLHGEGSGVFDYNRHNVVSGPNKGQIDLQYPDSLGGDEYNQFVMFTMYQQESSKIETAEKAVVQAEQEYDSAIAAEISGIAEQLKVSIDGEGDGFLFMGPEFTDIAVNAFVSTGASLTQAISVALQETLGRVEEATTFELFGTEFDAIPGVNFTQNFNQVLLGEGAVARFEENIARAEGELARARKKFGKTVTERTEAQKNQFLNDRSTNTTENAAARGLNIKTRGEDSNVQRTRINPATSKINSTIALYIPNKIVNNNAITYNGVNFSAARAAADLLFRADTGAAGFLARRKLLSFVDGLGSIIGADINAESVAQAVTGLAINPRQEMLFNQVQPRSFDFSFSFAPRNAKEAQEVAEIIRTFRKFSHPSLPNGAGSLKVPAEFEIRYYKVYNNDVTAENLFLNKIGRCALTAINVDFTPNAVMSTFPDGSPVRTTLTMTFQELRPLTREDIEEGY